MHLRQVELVEGAADAGHLVGPAGGGCERGDLRQVLGPELVALDGPPDAADPDRLVGDALHHVLGGQDESDTTHRLGRAVQRPQRVGHHLGAQHLFFADRLLEMGVRVAGTVAPVLDHHLRRPLRVHTVLVSVGVRLHGQADDVIGPHGPGEQGVEDDPGHGIDRGLTVAVSGDQAGVK